MMDLMMYMPGTMDGPMGGWGGFWWPFMLVPLLLWGVLLSLLVWFAVRLFSRGRGDARPGSQGLRGGDPAGALRPRRHLGRGVRELHEGPARNPATEGLRRLRAGSRRAA